MRAAGMAFHDLLECQPPRIRDIGSSLEVAGPGEVTEVEK